MSIFNMHSAFVHQRNHKAHEPLRGIEINSANLSASKPSEELR